MCETLYLLACTSAFKNHIDTPDMIFLDSKENNSVPFTYIFLLRRKFYPDRNVEILMFIA